MSEHIVIETPRGWIKLNESGMAKLEWNPNFKPKWTKRYTDAQKFVDKEVLRRCEPFIPLRTGSLIKSGELGTFVGSGVVSWIVPYAAAQYYMTNRRKTLLGGLRGSFWFERMKQRDAKYIIWKAKRIAAGKDSL